MREKKNATPTMTADHGPQTRAQKRDVPHLLTGRIQSRLRSRDAEACVVDHPWIPFNPQALSQRSTAVTEKELERLWQGEASGARPRCKSTFGVYDMTGNIDEWTTATSSGRPSILKGGYWGPVRTRCRPATRAHGEAHVFYQQGLRCCANPPPEATGDR